jgi:hypothetical protein
MTDPLDPGAPGDDSADAIRWSEAREAGIPEATLKRAMEHCPNRRDDYGEFYFLCDELNKALKKIAWEDANK